ncbi:MAG: CMP-N-acetylneuraminic acid synthetase [Neisseriaceae bacterium]|nr:MAG: CMP-N-acetylneuraminic acid synthetase [Neisseriaceae bacterium]
MKIIIPVKACSKRIENKNFREFYDGLSLTEILLKKLSFKGMENIYISSENSDKKKLAKKYGCNFILRKKELCDNNTPLPDVIRGISKQLPKNTEEIAWCQVTDPLFNDHKKAFEKWEAKKEKHDSLCVIYPFKKYILNSNHMPINFGFGNWHIKSQDLSTFYDMTFTFSILKKECIERCGYHIGSNPYWYNANNQHIDIDTMEDFEIASIIYGKKIKK